MPRQNIGEQSDHQREGFGEQTDKLDCGHNRNRHFEPRGHFGPEDLLPIVARTEHIDSKERRHRQHQRNRDITRNIRSRGEDRDQSHQVIDEDKEERRQQIGGKLTIVWPDAGDNDTLHHRIDHHFEHACQTTLCLRVGLVVAIATRHAQHNEQQHRTIHKQTRHGLGYRQINRTNDLALSRLFDNLARILSSVGNAETFVLVPCVQVRRRETVPLARLRTYNHKQRNRYVVLAHGADMPLVAIGNMVEDNRLDINPLLLRHRLSVLRHLRRNSRNSLGLRIVNRLLPPRGTSYRQRTQEQYVDPQSHHFLFSGVSSSAHTSIRLSNTLTTPLRIATRRSVPCST